MQNVQIAILGMRRLGGSVGLALRRYNERKDARQKFTVTGYDPDERQAERGRTMGACDTTVRGGANAVRDKDLVVIALPYHEVESAYKAFGPDLRAGAVLLDLSPYKAPSAAWAGKSLNKAAFFVGLTLIGNARYLFDGLDDIDHATADYFDSGTALVAPAANVDRDAVQLASDFASILGATPRFTDPLEHDSWAAVMEALPAAVGLAVFESMRRQGNWDDLKRVGNPAFGQVTHHLLEMHPDALRDLLLHDPVVLARQIDGLIETLTALRDVIATKDRDAIEAVTIAAQDDYALWLAKRRTGDWDGNVQERPTTQDAVMTGLLGSAITKRLKGATNRT